MYRYLVVILLSIFTLSCTGQIETPTEQIVGGACQDCEALLDFKLLAIQPTSLDTLPGFANNEPKLKLTGTVYEHDGKTPARDILLYVYHVDRKGIYQPRVNPVGWEKRHGQHRGWLKTDKKGKYTFFTFLPVPYPGGEEPAHIHLYVKEPHTVPYYLDNYLFEPDSMVTPEIRAAEKSRGGSGIVQLEMENGIWTANRNIILGLNIPDYENPTQE